MMSTLPGLPMFGHGQIEGFTEKYGMEYRWPRYEENPDHWLVERHEREIAPLLKRRWLFAESGNFLLYDFFSPNGSVNEDVFAYSNRTGGERALVVYHNRYGDARGTIDFSAAYADKGSGKLDRRRLAEGLGLSGDPGAVVAWRDSLTGLEYLRRAEDLIDRGLSLDLHAYQCHVFLDWRELRPTAQQPWDRALRLAPWPRRAQPCQRTGQFGAAARARCAAAVAGTGSSAPFCGYCRAFRAAGPERAKNLERERSEFLKDICARGELFLSRSQAAYAERLRKDDRPIRVPAPAESVDVTLRFAKLLRAAARIPAVETIFPAPWTAAARRVLPSQSPQLTATAMWGPVLAWCVLQLLAESIDPEHPERAALDLFDRLRLREPIAQALDALGFGGEEAWRVAARIKVLLLAAAGVGAVQEPAPVSEVEPAGAPGAPAPDYGTGEGKSEPAAPQPEQETVALPSALWLDPDVRWLCGVHEAEGHAYLVRERYEELLWWLLMPSLLRLAGEPVAQPRGGGRAG